MKHLTNRRDFIKLAGIGGVVCASSLGCNSLFKGGPAEDFYFVQLSDTHWGFTGPAVNPDADGTLRKAVAAVNSLDQPPDFIVFTGDLTQTTDDPNIRGQRMNQFRDITSGLKVKTVHYMAGEHDASLDAGAAYKKLFGELHYAFDYRGVHFIVIDNVSDPQANIGAAQLQWLQDDLKKLQPESPIVVFTHRPLFDLYPQWDWATPDAAATINALMPFKNVTVFYGHIHQEHHYMTGHIAHHAAKSLMFPLPAPGSVPKRVPVAWDPATPYKGLGWRKVGADVHKAEYKITEEPVTKG